MENQEQKETLIELAKQEFAFLDKYDGQTSVSEADEKLFEAFVNGEFADYTEENDPDGLYDAIADIDDIYDFVDSLHNSFIAKNKVVGYLEEDDLYQSIKNWLPNNKLGIFLILTVTASLSVFRRFLDSSEYGFNLFLKLNDVKKKRTLSAEKIRWLLTDEKVKKLGTPSGLRIKGAIIEPLIRKDGLNLSKIDIDFFLIFERCIFDCFIKLNHAKIGGIIFNSSKIKGAWKFENDSKLFSIIALRIEIQTHLLLSKIEANYPLNFSFSQIQGNLYCQKLKINNDNSPSLDDKKDDSKEQDDSKWGSHLDFSLSTIRGLVNLEKLFLDQDHGRISFYQSSIDGIFYCRNCNFNSSTYALKLDHINVNERIGLKNNTIKDVIELSSASVGGLAIDGGEIKPNQIKFASYSTEYAIFASDITVTGYIYLNVKMTGIVYLSNATIERSINIKKDCQISYYKNEDKSTSPDIALELSNCHIKKNIEVDKNSQIEGDIRLNRTKIEGSLSLLNDNNKNNISLFYTNIDTLKIDRDSIISYRKGKRLNVQHKKQNQVN